VRNPKIHKQRIKEAVDNLRNQGVSSPTVREVAEEAEVSTGTAHRYLGELNDENPQDALNALAGSASPEEIAEIEDAAAQQAAQTWETTEPKARPKQPGEREITAKFNSTCSECGEHISKGEQVLYNPTGRRGQKVRHKPGQCPNQPQAQDEGDEPTQDEGEPTQDAGSQSGKGQPSDTNGQPGNQDAPSGETQAPSPTERPEGAGDDDFTPFSYVDPNLADIREVAASQAATLQSVAKVATQNLNTIQEHTSKLTAHESSIDTLASEQELQKKALQTAKVQFDALETRTEKLEKKVGRLSQGRGGNITITVGEVTVELGDGETLHAQAEKAAKILKTLKVLWLCGPTGSGKTHLAAQLAKILNCRSFAPYSCTQGMTEGQLLGRLGFDNIFLSTPFVDCYENGGLVLLDEYDALNDNVRLVTNSAIANAVLSLPNRIENPQAERHEDFLLVIGTNTWGYGSDDFYTGRDTIDGATQDRFALAKILLDYDPLLEATIPGFDDYDPADIYSPPNHINGNVTNSPEALPQALEQIRSNTRRHQFQQEVSTRTKINSAKLRDAGFSTVEILEIFFTGWAERDVRKALEGVR
jgi:energy-coupling factor transporter ATP-binding protein EcfA2